MDRHNLPSHTPRGPRYGSSLLHQDQLDYCSGQESVVPEWPEVHSPYSAEQHDPGSDALWLPLRESNRGAPSFHHARDRDSLHEVPAPFDQMTSAFPSTNAESSRRNRRGATNRRRSREMERDLKAQLERLKQEHEALAAEKVRLQQVTTLMEQEVQRRREAEQMMLARGAADAGGDPFQ